MKVPNVRGTDKPYWDDGNKNEYIWFKKGWWKRYYRKKFLKELFNSKS